MKKLLGLLLVLGLIGCAQQPTAQISAADVLKAANEAIGVEKVNTLAFTSSGSGATFGQAHIAFSPWPRITYSRMNRHYDYVNESMSEQAARSRAEVNGGGAVPLMNQGEQVTNWVLNGKFTWNLTPNPAASPVGLDARVHDLWTSPHGVLKAAAKNNPVVGRGAMDGQAMTTLEFTDAGRFKALVFINDKNQVARVDSIMPNAVIGDTRVETHYDDYKDRGDGVQFPSRIRQSISAFNVMEVNVDKVTVNSPLSAAIPDGVRNFAENATAEKVAETAGLGVWFIAGGSHNSVAIEMADHFVVVESPLYDGRTNAVLDKVRSLVPNKPIKYVINSHHHFDHAGGLRAAAAQGATLVTSSLNKSYYVRALATPNRIKPDALAASKLPYSIEDVFGKRVMQSGNRKIEILEMKDSVHAQGFLMVYLPVEKILIEADAYTPAAPNAPVPAKPNDNHLNLASNINASALDIERILPLHGRVVPLSEFKRGLGQ
jgi:glyoxylase-like metal-dependent hydrolase (beta-lactamase superfamily II)